MPPLTLHTIQIVSKQLYIDKEKMIQWWKQS